MDNSTNIIPYEETGGELEKFDNELNNIGKQLNLRSDVIYSLAIADTICVILGTLIRNTTDIQTKCRLKEQAEICIALLHILGENVGMMNMKERCLGIINSEIKSKKVSKNTRGGGSSNSPNQQLVPRRNASRRRARNTNQREGHGQLARRSVSRRRNTNIRFAPTREQQQQMTNIMIREREMGLRGQELNIRRQEVQMGLLEETTVAVRAARNAGNFSAINTIVMLLLALLGGTAGIAGVYCLIKIVMGSLESVVGTVAYAPVAAGSAMISGVKGAFSNIKNGIMTTGADLFKNMFASEDTSKAISMIDTTLGQLPSVSIDDPALERTFAVGANQYGTAVGTVAHQLLASAVNQSDIWCLGISVGTLLALLIGLYAYQKMRPIPAAIHVNMNMLDRPTYEPRIRRENRTRRRNESRFLNNE